MRIEIHTAMKGGWRAFRFECPACHHVTVAKAYGGAQAAGAAILAGWTAANAEADAALDAARAVETAACPRCQHRDPTALRRYGRRRVHLLIGVGVAAVAAVLSALVLPIEASFGIAFIVLLGFSLVGGMPLSGKQIAPATERVWFPLEATPPPTALPAPGECALFLCKTCRKTAGTLLLREAMLEQRDSFEDVDDPIAETELAALAAGLAANDAKALWTAEPRWVPFYCAPCEGCYCAEHWELLEGDAMRARCASGHEHEVS